MAKGKTQEDVFEAANALLRNGERPTVEKIRAYLGGGSPNTVGPHLDAFYRSLANRLGGKPVTSLSAEIPIPVARAAEKLWTDAVELAREEFSRKLEAGLAAAHEARNQAMSNAAALTESLAAAQSRTSQLAVSNDDLKKQLEQVHAQLAQTTAELQGERRASEDLRDQLLAAARELNQIRAQCQADVKLANERVDAAGERAAKMIDAERVARRTADARVESLTRQVESLREKIHENDLAAAEKLGRAEGEVAALREQLSQAVTENDQAKARLQAALSDLAEATQLAGQLRAALDLAKANQESARPQPTARSRQAKKGSA